MRLFIAIELPGAVRLSAAAAAQRVRERVTRSAPRAVLRWVQPENLHITVWFLGEVREPRVAELAATLALPLDVTPFPMQLGGAGTFPERRAPRALWLGVRDGREGVTAVHDALCARLMPLGFEPEERAYTPHLTIARVKEIAPPDAAAVRTALQDIDNVGDGFEIGAATLFRSRPGPAGAQYEPASHIRLSG